MSEIIRLLNDEILPRVNRAEVFAALQPVDKGDYIACVCPGCQHESGFIYKNSTYLKCNRENNCSYSTSIFDYMSGEAAPRGDDWWKVAEKLAAMAGVVLPTKDDTANASINAAVTARRTLEGVWLDSKRIMDECPEGKEYMATRGLMGADVGYFFEAPDKWAMEWERRLVIPLKDKHGNLRALVGRDTTGKAEKKYLYTKDAPLKEMGFIGLDTALKGKPTTMILVEGVIDRIRLQLAGVQNVAALGNANVSLERLTLLNELGIRKIILALDNDTAGKKATTEAIQRAYELLVPPEMLVKSYVFKDADEDLSNDIAWADKAPEPAHTWLAKQYIEHYPNKEDFVEAVIRFDERITNPLRIAHMALHFFPIIQDHLGLFETPLMELYAIRRQQNIQQKSNNLIQAAAAKAKQLGAAGSHKLAKEALFEGYRESEALLKSSHLEPVRTLNERLIEHEQQILAYRDREILGLKCDMHELTSALMGLRGLIFLGSGPNLGKTVLSVQLALQVLANQPDCCVVYINLDMDTSDVLTRIRCNMGEFEWKKYTQGHSIPIDQGREKVQSVGNRLVILDEKCFSGEEQELIEVVNALKASSGCKRAMIVLDYLQVWEVPEEKRRILRSDNDVDEWRVSVVKRLKGCVDKHDAVLVISEVRKEAYDRELTMQDLKGSSRLSYAGDVVLLLQRLTSDEYCENFGMEATGLQTYYLKRAIDKIEDKKKEAKKIQEHLEQNSITVGYLQVAKGRDGTLRKKIPVTAHFKLAAIVEGFHVDGIPKKQLPGAKHEQSKSMDQGALQSGVDERAIEWWQK